MLSQEVTLSDAQATPLIFSLEYSIEDRPAWTLNSMRVGSSSHLLGTPLIRLSGFPTSFIDLLEQLGFVPRRPV